MKTPEFKALRSAYWRKKSATLLRFHVYSLYGADEGCVGSVCLHDQALEHHVEHALAAVGLYAPRGADQLVWGGEPEAPWASIFDGSDNEIIRLVTSHGDAP